MFEQNSCPKTPLSIAIFQALDLGSHGVLETRPPLHRHEQQDNDQVSVTPCV